MSTLVHLHRFSLKRFASTISVRYITTSQPYRRQYFSRMYESLLTEDVHSKDSAMSCKSQKLMLYNGLMAPAHTGAYHLLPMGLRSLNKLKRIINQEMDSIGAQELNFSTISSSQLWKKSGRWKSTGSELFKLRDRHEIEYCLGPTYEEVVTSLLASHRVVSHRKLPVMLYQITRKFRDEMAPKYGLLRGREFEMKDLYTFDASEDDARKTYDIVCDSYERIFGRLELDYVKVAGDTGNIGGSLSHEYHLPSLIGQDTLLTCQNCGFGSNTELLPEDTERCPKCENELTQTKGIEIAHSFLLGTKYSKVFKAKFVNENRENLLMEMGCYGIGVTRLLAACMEVLSTEDEIRWPKLISPFQVCIIPQKEGFKSEVTDYLADKLYDEINRLPNMKSEVVIDDRIKFTIGKRMYQAKTLGYPFVVTLGKQALDDTPKFELIDVYENRNVYLEENELLKSLAIAETVSK